ncbi:MAG: hypothetical protein AABX94_02670 [Nanoarchaeota archaeon]
MVKPLLRIVGSSTEGAENRNRFGCYYGELEDSKETYNVTSFEGTLFEGVVPRNTVGYPGRRQLVFITPDKSMHIYGMPGIMERYDQLRLELEAIQRRFPDKIKSKKSNI